MKSNQQNFEIWPWSDMPKIAVFVLTFMIGGLPKVHTKRSRSEARKSNYFDTLSKKGLWSTTKNNRSKNWIDQMNFWTPTALSVRWNFHFIVHICKMAKKSVKFWNITLWNSPIWSYMPDEKCGWLQWAFFTRLKRRLALGHHKFWPWKSSSAL